MPEIPSPVSNSEQLFSHYDKNAGFIAPDPTKNDERLEPVDEYVGPSELVPELPEDYQRLDEQIRASDAHPLKEPETEADAINSLNDALEQSA